MKIDQTLSWGTVSNPGIAAELVRRSWGGNRGTVLNYDESLFRSCFAYPGAESVLTPALYQGSKLVAFVLGMPRRVVLNGQTRKLILMTFFTVSPEWKGHGVGVAIWAQCLRQAREYGYDGSIHFCVDGNISNHVTLAGARQAGFEARPLLTVRYLMLLLRSIPLCLETSREPSCEDFLSAARGLSLPLVRLWTPAEVEWQCGGRVDPICATYRSGENCGALSGYRLCTLDPPKTVYSFVDDVLWHQLTETERSELLQCFLRRAAKVSQVAVVPLLGYADMAPFLREGFRRSTRVLKSYLTVWNGSMEADIRSVYIDVL